MAEWKIRRRHQQCSRCESTFEDGTRHVSLLRIEEEEEAIVREDLCRSCWKGADQAEIVFWWATRFCENRKKSLQLDLDSLERLFTQLDGTEKEKLRELRYLICLLLMRKRKLKLVRVARSGGEERLILRRPRRKEELEVYVFDFTPEKIEEMRVRLQEVLEGAGPEEEGAGERSEEDSADPVAEPVAEAGPPPCEAAEGDPESDRRPEVADLGS